MLGISHEDLSSLNEKTLKEKFNDYALKIHPDVTGGTEDQKKFFADWMAKLNQAREDLLEYIHSK
jgi:hypothetical protein